MKNLIFVVLLVLLAAPVKAQTTVPFHQKGAMILIDAQVNGHTATLLLDTGADCSIVSLEVAGVLAKLQALRSTGGAGSEGDYVKASVDLRIGNRHWIERTVLAMDMSDVSKRMGVKIDGLLGQDLLSGFSSVTIDYKNKTVSFN